MIQQLELFGSLEYLSLQHVREFSERIRQLA